jgi:DNA-directed RNA polymerase subunit RPC12/RpoP
MNQKELQDFRRKLFLEKKPAKTMTENYLQIYCGDTLRCPYCGEKIEGEFENDSDDIDCESCGKNFHYDREYEINYLVVFEKEEEQ